MSDASNKYDDNKYIDLIHAERPWPGDTKRKHPPMSRQNRAAQFAPFEALRGHKGDLGHENWKLTRTRRIELSEEDTEHLSDKLVQVSKGDVITVVYFVPDEGDVGCYNELEGMVAAIDPTFQTLQIENKSAIPGRATEHIDKCSIRFSDIIDVSGENIITFESFGI